MHVVVIIFVFVCIISISIFIKWYNSPEQKGKRGEARVRKILSRLPEEYRVMNDIVLLTGRGTAQIDHVVVSRYGVFAIETKNYRGDIYGDDCRMEWTQIIVTKVRYSRKSKKYTYVSKNKWYNPVKQAKGHANKIKSLLNDWPYAQVIPIVVFVGKANIKNVFSNSHVIYHKQLLSTIKSYNIALLTDEDVGNISDLLLQVNKREVISNREHVRSIKMAKKEMKKKVSSNICPWCGGVLFKRKGQYGTFYGCSNYPVCKFTHT